MKKKIFTDVDFTDFWDDCDYSLEEYVEVYPDDDLIASVEQELGYKLPVSYIELMRLHNGGMSKRNGYPTTEPTCWAQGHVAVTGFLGIGRNKRCSLCGDFGSQF